MSDPSEPQFPNPSAPDYTPDKWNKNEVITIKNGKAWRHVFGANCFQYAFAGSNKDGENNLIHEEEVPNPGTTAHLNLKLYTRNNGHMGDISDEASNLLNALMIDGVPIVSKNEMPPAKPGFYLVGVYLHEGKEGDYHFVRQDRRGSWSSKEGQSTPVTHYLPPNPDGSYRKLEGNFGNSAYAFVGYAYAPEEGINFGIEVPIAKSLQAHPDGAKLKEFFATLNKSVFDNVRDSLTKHYPPDIVARFDAARKKYVRVVSADAPAFDPDAWKGRADKHYASSYQYAFAGSTAEGENKIYAEESAIPGRAGGQIGAISDVTTLINMLAVDGITIVGKKTLPEAKPDHYLVGIYVDPKSGSFAFVRQDSDGGWSLQDTGDGTALRAFTRAKDGGYQPLPDTFQKLKFVGYTYAPKEGKNLGLDVIVASSLKRDPTGQGIKILFEHVDPDLIADIADALQEHYPEHVQAFENARVKYTVHANPDAPIFQPRRWATGLFDTSPMQYAFAGSGDDGNNMRYWDEPIPYVGNTGGTNAGYAPTASDAALLDLLKDDGIDVVPGTALPAAKEGQYRVAIYRAKEGGYGFSREDKDGGWSYQQLDGVIARHVESPDNGKTANVPQKLEDMHLVGFGYVPKKGLNLGIELAVVKELEKHPDGAGLKALFTTLDPKEIALIRQAINDDYPAHLSEFEAAQEKFAPPTPAKPAVQATAPTPPRP